MSEPDALVRLRPAGESAWLVELAREIGAAATDRVLRFTAALDAAALSGVLDRVPGYTTVLVTFDPATADRDALASELRRLGTTDGPLTEDAGRLVTIPVCYGGAHGPDLEDVARRHDLGQDDVVARHAGAEYRVACLGFVPGFAYLVGLPPELTTPRIPSPRTRVPPGSVGIGGSQTGVYPLETPGGWNLIGRTPLRPFDPDRAEPFLLAAGDRVRFKPVDEGQYACIIEMPGTWPKAGG